MKTFSVDGEVRIYFTADIEADTYEEAMRILESNTYIDEYVNDTIGIECCGYLAGINGHVVEAVG